MMKIAVVEPHGMVGEIMLKVLPKGISSNRIPVASERSGERDF
jgi:aspartate-semialdehyde dehydrogenase